MFTWTHNMIQRSVYVRWDPTQVLRFGQITGVHLGCQVSLNGDQPKPKVRAVGLWAACEQFTLPSLLSSCPPPSYKTSLNYSCVHGQSNMYYVLCLPCDYEIKPSGCCTSAQMGDRFFTLGVRCTLRHVVHPIIVEAFG